MGCVIFIYLFIRGKPPSLPWLWFRAGVTWFAGSENMILNMVHVVETFAEVKKRKISEECCVEIYVYYILKKKRFN